MSATTKFDGLDDEELKIITFALEDLRYRMRAKWNDLTEQDLGYDYEYIWQERARQGRELNDLILETSKEKYARDTAKRV